MIIFRCGERKGHTEISANNLFLKLYWNASTSWVGTRVVESTSHSFYAPQLSTHHTSRVVFVICSISLLDTRLLALFLVRESKLEQSLIEKVVDVV